MKQQKQQLLKELNGVLQEEEGSLKNPDDWIVLGDADPEGAALFADASIAIQEEAKVSNLLHGNPLIDIRQLQSICITKGVPLRLRATVWRVLCGYLSTNPANWRNELELSRAKYGELSAGYDLLLQTPQEQWGNGRKTLFNDIRVDLPRTALPGFSQICNQKESQKLLGRVLFLWACHTKDSISYFQGQLDLAYIFLLCFLGENPQFNGDIRSVARVKMSSLTKEFLNEVEADIYWCLAKLMEKLSIAFTRDFTTGIDSMLDEMSRIVSIGDCATWKSFLSKDCRLPDFAFRWMVCLLVRELRVPRAMRLWDCYFGLWNSTLSFAHFHIYICAALVLTFGNRLQKLDFFELVNFMQHLPLDHWTDNDIYDLILKARDLLHLDISSTSISVPPSTTTTTTNSNEMSQRIPTIPTPNPSGTLLLQRRSSGSLKSVLSETLQNILMKINPNGNTSHGQHKKITMETAAMLVVYVLVIAITLIVLITAASLLLSSKTNPQH